MVAVLSLIATTVALAAAAPEPTAAPVNVKPAAMDVAQLIAPDAYLLFTGGTLPELEAGLARMLLSTHAAWLGRSCDPAHPDCQAAARRVAKDYAPKVQGAARRQVEQLFATVLTDMPDKDLASTRAFLRTASGQAFASQLRLLLNPRGDARFYQQMDAALRGGGAPGGTKGMFEDFHRATMSLPRAPLRAVPRPPRVVMPESQK
jgi:hypothetical protein